MCSVTTPPHLGSDRVGLESWPFAPRGPISRLSRKPAASGERSKPGTKEEHCRTGVRGQPWSTSWESRKGVGQEGQEAEGGRSSSRVLRRRGRPDFPCCWPLPDGLRAPPARQAPGDCSSLTYINCPTQSPLTPQWGGQGRAPAAADLAETCWASLPPDGPPWEKTPEYSPRRWAQMEASFPIPRKAQR